MHKLLLFPLALALLAPTSNAQTTGGSLGPQTPIEAGVLSFGEVVAADGEYAVVSAPLYEHSDSNGSYPDVGTAFVFRYVGGSWVQLAQLLPSDVGSAPQHQWSFGDALAIQGDTVAVGTPGHDGACPTQFFCNSGAVYVFERAGDDWIEQQKIVPADNAENDKFGFQVRLAGDQLLVAAPGDDELATLCGSIYVFERSGSTWVQMQKLTPSDARSYIQFGTSMHTSEDQLIVGTPAHPHSGSNGVDWGRAYVFRRNGGVWTEEAILDAPSYHSDMYMGSAVGVSGDYAAVGAMGRNANNTHDGATYVFERAGGTWNLVETLTRTGTLANEGFGVALALLGERLVVGRQRMVSNLTDQAWLYERVGGTWTEVTGITTDSPPPADFIGRDVVMTPQRLVFSSLVRALSFEFQPDGQAFCDAVPNSTGAVGDLGASGSLEIVANDLVLHASSLPKKKLGYFLVSDGLNLPGTIPNGSSGVLCLGGTIGRYTKPGQVFSTGTVGGASLPIDWTAIPTSSGTVHAQPGETWYFQAWHRDFTTGHTSNFTVGLGLTVE